MDETVEPMPNAREGDCIALPSDSGVWAVRGRTGWFRCNSNTQRCECADFLARKRRGDPLTPCSHLRSLALHLDSAGRKGEFLTGSATTARDPKELA